MTEMELMDYLNSQFGKNEPIFSEEVDSIDVRIYLLESAQNLIRVGSIAEYSENVYYIPVQTPFGQSTLCSNKVYEKKYIHNKSGVMGYYSGNKLLNLIGLTTQVPNVVEITSNKASEDKQLIKEGKSIIELNKPPIEITYKNVDTLQFLEAIATMLSKTYYHLNNDDVKGIFRTFLSNHMITKKI